MTDISKAGALRQKAKTVRREVLKMIHKAKSGHPGGSLSAADIMTVLYFNELNVNPKKPDWNERDRFILSKGHVCPVLYTCLALCGYFAMEQLGTLRVAGSILQGHPDMKRCPGIDMSTGSLGQGASVGVGMALAAKRDGQNLRVFVLVGDGETNEGQIWEAVQSAVKYKLSNFILIVDNNGLQNDGPCDEVMPTGDIAKKLAAFGMDVYECNGHDMDALLDAFSSMRRSDYEGPRALVAKTVKGKGVSFMENIVAWHGMAPNDAQLAAALEEIGHD